MGTGVEFIKKNPIKRNPILKYFVKGWWTDEQDRPIKEAIIGDTVKFHLETKNIPSGDEVMLSLYDDDTKVKPLEEDHKDDEIKLVYTANGKSVITDKVKDNKIVKIITLKNFEEYLKDDKDGILELFFKCKYKNENTNFPFTPKEYLKVKGMPKIIFINGQWKLAERVPFGLGENLGPTEPKKPYWASGIADGAIGYLNKEFSIQSKYVLNGILIKTPELEKRNFVLYYDGSSSWGGDQSGGDRFSNGKKFAEKNYEEITKGLGGEAVYLVSHSEGGAFAAGVADYLYSKDIKIGEHILLSPDEGDEFSVNPEIPSYQLTYMFFSSVLNPTATIVNTEKMQMFNKRFRRWGKYYAIVDWVTNEFRVKGTKKMGIAHVQNAGWSGVHGWTNGSRVFDKISDLKQVRTFDVIGSHDDKFYSGKDHTTTTNGTVFYRIDEEYIITKCPPIAIIK